MCRCNKSQFQRKPIKEMGIRYSHAKRLFQIYKVKLITNQRQKEGGNTNIGMLVIKKAA
jgi:hypothetical protein